MVALTVLQICRVAKLLTEMRMTVALSVMYLTLAPPILRLVVVVLGRWLKPMSSSNAKPLAISIPPCAPLSANFLDPPEDPLCPLCKEEAQTTEH